ncbi:YdcF family protein [Massilia sp. NR 4-1]|uniref:YdcF family protein n=1 Tax=Massilia sp. NR 4-1 TaxID=1678028 RepID=UPI00067BF2AF|nr:YdcF family protein [Massilia sp. NR 4-1]AKU21083.1 hypothetical protein ACZ75_05860 [Massilia sp. NR 4-1]
MTADFAISVLSHVVLLPPMNLFLLMAAGWLLARRWPRLGRGVGSLALGVLVLLCTDAGARLLAAPLESRTRALPPGAAQRSGAQAIVILAAGRIERAPEYGGDIPDRIALARLRYGARLQHETGLPLLVSGGNATADGKVEAKARGMARALHEDFRTPVRWIEAGSATTAQNAQLSAPLLRAARVRRILLVTDAMHMPRAQACFAAAGFEVVAAPTMFESLGRLTPLQFLPSANALQRSYYATYEWMGLAWYWLRAARA